MPLTRDPCHVDHARYCEDLAAIKRIYGEKPKPGATWGNQRRAKELNRVDSVYRECVALSALPANRKLEYQLPHVFRNGIVMRLTNGNRRIIPKGRT